MIIKVGKKKIAKKCKNIQRYSVISNFSRGIYNTYRYCYYKRVLFYEYFIILTFDVLIYVTLHFIDSSKELAKKWITCNKYFLKKKSNCFYYRDE